MRLGRRGAPPAPPGLPRGRSRLHSFHASRNARSNTGRGARPLPEVQRHRESPRPCSFRRGRHALLARKFSEDEEKWGIIGLVHDIDYEQFPEQHCKRSPEILQRTAGFPEDYIRAVVSHGWGMCSEVEPVHRMEKVLYTIDELTGLVKASALMRPSRSVLDMEASSVKKKWKDARFAGRREQVSDRKGRRDDGRRDRRGDLRRHCGHADGGKGDRPGRERGRRLSRLLPGARSPALGLSRALPEEPIGLGAERIPFYPAGVRRFHGSHRRGA